MDTRAGAAGFALVVKRRACLHKNAVDRSYSLGIQRRTPRKNSHTLCVRALSLQSTERSHTILLPFAAICCQSGSIAPGLMTRTGQGGAQHDLKRLRGEASRRRCVVGRAVRAGRLAGLDDLRAVWSRSDQRRTRNLNRPTARRAACGRTSAKADTFAGSTYVTKEPPPARSPEAAGPSSILHPWGQAVQSGSGPL